MANAPGLGTVGPMRSVFWHMAMNAHVPSSTSAVLRCRTGAFLLLIGGAVFACGPTARGGPGERCNTEERQVGGVTEVVGICDDTLTCIRYDFECGLNAPWDQAGCQNEECLDCDAQRINRRVSLTSSRMWPT